MAIGDYAKTTYVNGSTPAINHINLNKNETRLELIDTNLKSLSIDSSVVTTVNGFITEVLEKIAGVNYQRTTNTYTNSLLTNVNVKRYATNGSTIIAEWNEVLSYTSGSLTGIVKTIV